MAKFKHNEYKVVQGTAEEVEAWIFIANEKYYLVFHNMVVNSKGIITLLVELVP